MARLDSLKKALRPLGAVAGLTGAAALVNRQLRESGPLPNDHFGGIRRRWSWRGYEIFATELGTGPLVLLVHGIYAGAGSYEFRYLAPMLARRHRVVAFDLIGCGLSDMPDLDYSADLFVEQIVDAITEFSSEPMTLLGSSLGAAFAIRAAVRASDRVARLVTICPTGLGGVLAGEPRAAQTIAKTVFRSPVVGEAAFNGLASRQSIKHFLVSQTFADRKSATPEVIEHYYAVTHQPGARFVPASFVGGALNCNVARDLPFLEAKLLVLWGERAAKVNPVDNAHDYVRLAGDAKLEIFPHSGMLPHEEEPAAVSVAVERFIASSPAQIERRVQAHPFEPVARTSHIAPISDSTKSLEVEPGLESAPEPEPAGVAEIVVALVPSGESPAFETVAAAAGAEDPAETVQKATHMARALNPAIFKSYDVRGLYPEEFDDEIAYGIGRAFVEEIGAKTIVVGRDMRPSGEALFAAFARGANEAGADVVDVGLVSTDALYFAVGKYGYGGGVMITASHNPAQYNGMKFTRRLAQAISLETGLSAMRDKIASGNFAPPAERAGTITQRDILEDFAQHCLTFIDPSVIKPFKIAIDAGNGMAGRTVPYVFEHLPCHTIPMYFELDGTFPNHPASPIEPENMVDLQRAVLENHCDLGVAFDGDADRMFIVDEKGGLIGGDMVTALVGINTLEKSPGSKVLYNLICSRSVPEAISRAGGIPVRSQVGHSLIKKIMADENVVFGGEHSGHFYFRDNWFADSGMIALLQCLEVFSKADRPVSEVIAPIDGRFRSGEVNTRVADIPGKMKALEAHFHAGEIDHLDGVTIQFSDWWLNVRPSNTEPLLRLNVEGDTKELMEARRDEALAIIRS